MRDLPERTSWLESDEWDEVEFYAENPEQWEDDNRDELYWYRAYTLDTKIVDTSAKINKLKKDLKQYKKNRLRLDEE